jgi:response regulator NasT
MTRRNLSEPEAFRLLQRQSQDKRMPMAKLAESIVQADEFFEAGAPPAPAPVHRSQAHHHRGEDNV